MLVIGLTGGIGSGKSTVAARFMELGAVVVDADAITRELQQPGKPVFAAMVDRFGSDILWGDGTLNRQIVADLVFSNADALLDLNGIVHPAVADEIARRLRSAEVADELVILDVPLLVEAGRDDLGATIVVDCDVEAAVSRLVEGRGYRRADALARIAAQIDRRARTAAADFVIDNSGPIEALGPQIDRAWAWIHERAAAAAIARGGGSSHSA